MALLTLRRKDSQVNTEQDDIMYFDNVRQNSKSYLDFGVQSAEESSGIQLQFKEEVRQPAFTVTYQPEYQNADTVMPSYEEELQASEMVYDEAVDTEKQQVIDEYEDLPSDLMPSRQTMMHYSSSRAVEYQREDLPQTKEHIQISLNSKGKILVAVYIAVILTMLIVALIAASTINTLRQDEQGLLSQVTQKRAEIQSLYDDLQSVSDEIVLQQQANTQLGMFTPSPETVKTIDLPKISQATEYKIQTNWFDAFCDLLNNIFGG